MPKRPKKTSPPPALRAPDKHQPSSSVPASVVARAELWSGPLPSPQSLKDFDAVVPGAAKTIIEMAQAQQKHRMYLEKRGAADHHYGLIFAGLVTLSAMAGAIYLAVTAPWVAVSLVSLPVLGFVKVLRSEGAAKKNKPA